MLLRLPGTETHVNTAHITRMEWLERIYFNGCERDLVIHFESGNITLRHGAADLYAVEKAVLSAMNNQEEM